ncbi:glucose-6-phosphate 1-epimerase, partial [Dorcoceras hygrometricum]
QHGFARNMNWSIVKSESITLDKNSLTTELNVKNTDEKPFSFGTTLHTYFNAFVSGASVRGLKGCKTLNKDPDPKNPVEGKEERSVSIMCNCCTLI